MKFDSLEQAQAEGRAPWTDVQLDTRDFVVYKDAYPVTNGHTLVVPKTNTQEEVLKCFKFALGMGNDNVAANNDITGFNIGLNIGASAGQTCMYPHVHLIFRRDNDCADATGGVRNVIPGKGNYKKTNNDVSEIEDINYSDGC